MIRGKAASALEPRRIVVELSREQFEQFDRACGRVAPATYLKLLALRELGGSLGRLGARASAGAAEGEGES
jgi:hypothetical protein